MTKRTILCFVSVVILCLLILAVIATNRKKKEYYKILVTSTFPGEDNNGFYALYFIEKSREEVSIVCSVGQLKYSPLNNTEETSVRFTRYDIYKTGQVNIDTLEYFLLLDSYIPILKGKKRQGTCYSKDSLGSFNYRILGDSTINGITLSHNTLYSLKYDNDGISMEFIYNQDFGIIIGGKTKLLSNSKIVYAKNILYVVEIKRDEYMMASSKCTKELPFNEINWW